MDAFLKVPEREEDERPSQNAGRPWFQHPPVAGSSGSMAHGICALVAHEVTREQERENERCVTRLGGWWTSTRAKLLHSLVISAQDI